jgi:hypothetical protein
MESAFPISSESLNVGRDAFQTMQDEYVENYVQQATGEIRFANATRDYASLALVLGEPMANAIISSNLYCMENRDGNTRCVSSSMLDPQNPNSDTVWSILAGRRESAMIQDHLLMWPAHQI